MAFSNHLRDNLKQGNADDQKQASKDLLFFSYFDEANKMTTDGSPKGRRSSYHVLGSVLAKMKGPPMFFVFLSTNSWIGGFAPSPVNHPSLRDWNDTTLHAPFTELPFDTFAHHLYDELKEKKGARGVTFADICEISYLVKFGRPL